MGQLIDDLLAYSRLSRAEMQLVEIDMADLVDSVFCELATTEEQRRIDLIIDPLPLTIGDSLLIRQVWTNLIANALKFSSKRERALIHIGSQQDDENHIYFVQDNGAGFDAQYANKLFGVFQRLHNEREFEGNGVGLAIVQRVIHRHNGKVWAEGKIDQGATFYFSLPIKEMKHDGV
jgi:light-regulated signal transduction histidine kinase (bacteriophytochrome)